MNLAATIAKMKAAGLSSDAIVTALECIVLDETERNSVAGNSATDVTPAALRMRRMRERKANQMRPWGLQLKSHRQRNVRPLIERGGMSTHPHGVLSEPQ